jgi:hypothetical protein
VILGLTLSDLLLRLVAMLVVVAASGFFLALFARLLGDRGPRDDGKLTLNPFEHLDYLAAIPFVLFETGWIKPQDVNPKLLRPQALIGAVLLVVFALAAVVALAGAIWWLRAPLQTIFTDAAAVRVLEGVVSTLLEVAVSFALLNLVPVPPLVAGVVLVAIAPRAAEILNRYSLVGRIALIAILATGVMQSAARPAAAALLRIVGAPA